MRSFIARRLLLVIPTLFAVAVVIFVLVRIVPGDIVELRLVSGGSFVTKGVIEAERTRLGLDKPIWEQFVQWIVGIGRLNLGLSMWTGAPISEEIAIRVPLSLQLAVMATLIAVALAVPLGVLSALRRNTWIDYGIQIFSVAGLATPSFWLGILMIFFLLTYFHWLPPLTFTSLFRDPKANLAQLIWPALAVGYRTTAVTTRMTRSALLEVLREDYIRTAWSKGLAERSVVFGHALRNAFIPVMAVIGLEFAFLIGGLVVTEQVFNLNGIGRLFVDAVTRRDYTLIQGLLLLVAFVYIAVNFINDVLFAWLDPRITYG
jgi:peptide/nickel transport system permease protein